jgi:uncharacterized protein
MTRVKHREKKIAVYDDMIGRKRLASILGGSYGGDRNLFTVLGYPTDIKFLDYYARYKRQDIASAVINRPVKYTWKGDVVVHNPNAPNDNMQTAWHQLYTDLKLGTRFRAVDKLASIGEYAVLLLGFDDVTTVDVFSQPIAAGKRSLLYVMPYSEDSAKISLYDKNPNSERFGKPLLYDITSGTEEGQTTTLQVHYSRIIHVIGDTLTSDVKGIPVLEKVYNRLMDIEKISGGSSEMFWRGARPGYQGIVDKEYEVDAALETDVETKIQKYEDNLTRIIMSEGFKLEALATQVSDPTAHLNVQIELISASTGIPKRILLGSERGELSSNQDADAWADIIEDRRTEIAEPQIVRPFVDICIKYGILPDEAYDVLWQSLHITSDADIAEVGRIRAAALQAYVANPAAYEIMPPEAFMKFLLGLQPEQINEVLAMIQADAFEMPEQEVEEQQEQQEPTEE